MCDETSRSCGVSRRGGARVVVWRAPARRPIHSLFEMRQISTTSTTSRDDAVVSMALVGRMARRARTRNRTRRARVRKLQFDVQHERPIVIPFPRRHVHDASASIRRARAAKELVRAWRECADWCRTRERGLLHYEISQSNKDELTYSIFERYASERAYAVTHKATEAYKTFRPKMQRLQDAGELKVSGASFFELGHGFVS